MPPQRDSATAPVAVGAFAAGAAVALLARRLVDARRNAGSEPERPEASDDGATEDLASVLRRAALDVAVLASGQAAERLQGEESATTSH